jgi:hypothetical protein
MAASPAFYLHEERLTAPDLREQERASMKNTIWAIAAAIVVCAEPSGLRAQFPEQERPDLQGGNGPGLAPPGAANNRLVMPAAFEQPEPDRHDCLHDLNHAAHATHIFNLHGEERATAVPQTRVASFKPLAAGRFASAAELAPALQTSEPAVGFLARGVGKLKTILAGIGGALAAIFGALSGKKTEGSE